MKRMAILLLLGVSSLTLITTARKGVAQSTAFKIEDATPVKLRLQRNVSSADAQVGEKVDFDVLDEITVNGVTVIPKGSVAWGTVTEAQAKRRMARGGKLEMNIDTVRLADGEKCPLRAVKDVKGGGHTGAMTAGIVATSLIVWPAAPFFLFMHGKDITIPEGTEITAYINGDMKLDLAKFTSPASSAPIAAPAVATALAAKAEPASNPAAVDSIAGEKASVDVKSTPDGAEITVDGWFVGNAPSTLKLGAGQHAISVSAAGFKAWERKVALTPGSSVTLNATLEKSQ